MKNIELIGLTEQHISLLSHMWTINTSDELDEWRTTLSASDYKASVTLEHILIMEYLEDGVTENLHVSKLLLKKIFSKK